jgi:type IV pilus assembly protein PilA
MLKQMMKDERGLSLVELLAVVVIMAIIAGIGAVTITNVIQNNKEDAGIAAVQSLMSAAVLYQTSNEGSDQAIGVKNPAVTAADIKSAGFISQLSSFDDSKIGNITFTLKNGAVAMTMPDGALKKAGGKTSQGFSDYTEENIAGLTRENTWVTPGGNNNNNDD